PSPALAAPVVIPTAKHFLASALSGAPGSMLAPALGNSVAPGRTVAGCVVPRGNVLQPVANQPHPSLLNLSHQQLMQIESIGYGMSRSGAGINHPTTAWQVSARGAVPSGHEGAKRYPRLTTKPEQGNGPMIAISRAQKPGERGNAHP